MAFLARLALALLLAIACYPVVQSTPESQQETIEFIIVACAVVYVLFGGAKDEGGR